MADGHPDGHSAGGDPNNLPSETPTGCSSSRRRNARFHVYQALTTRNGGEVISADSY